MGGKKKVDTPLDGYSSLASSGTLSGNAAKGKEEEINSSSSSSSDAESTHESTHESTDESTHTEEHSRE